MMMPNGGQCPPITALRSGWTPDRAATSPKGAVHDSPVSARACSRPRAETPSSKHFVPSQSHHDRRHARLNPASRAESISSGLVTSAKAAEPIGPSTHVAP